MESKRLNDAISTSQRKPVAYYPTLWINILQKSDQNSHRIWYVPNEVSSKEWLKGAIALSINLKPVELAIITRHNSPGSEWGAIA